MGFISAAKGRYRTPLVIVSVVLLLSSCSQLQTSMGEIRQRVGQLTKSKKQEGQKTTTEQETLSATEGEETEAAQNVAEGEPALKTIPNPYLSQTIVVPPQAQAQFELATRAMENKAWAQAKTTLQKLTAAYPKLSGPYVNLGIVYRQLGEHERAKKAYVRAIVANELNGDAYSELGLLHREQGRFEDAEAVYLRGVDIWPHHSAAILNLGILYDLYMGQWERALEQYTLYQSLQAEPNKKVKGWIVDLERRLKSSGGTRAQ